MLIRPKTAKFVQNQKPGLDWLIVTGKPKPTRTEEEGRKRNCGRVGRARRAAADTRIHRSDGRRRQDGRRRVSCPVLVGNADRGVRNLDGQRRERARFLLAHRLGEYPVGKRALK